MNWKWLWVVPLAAWWVGTRVEVPDLREPIPSYSEGDCDYEGARQWYLLAYAYAREDSARSRRLLEGAGAELRLCRGEVAVLGERIRELEENLARQALTP